MDDAVDELRAYAYGFDRALSTTELRAALTASGGNVDAACGSFGLPPRRLVERESAVEGPGAPLAHSPRRLSQTATSLPVGRAMSRIPASSRSIESASELWKPRTSVGPKVPSPLPKRTA